MPTALHRFRGAQDDSGWKGLRLSEYLAQPPAQSRTSHRSVCSVLCLVRSWLGWAAKSSELPVPLLGYAPGETAPPFIPSGYKPQAQPCLRACPGCSSISRCHGRVDGVPSPCVASLDTSLRTLVPCFLCSFLKSLLRKAATTQATNRVTGDTREKEA